MENLNNKQKYLILKNSIITGRIEENDFLKSFMQRVALQITKGYQLTNRQVEILENYLQQIMNYISAEDKESIDKLNEEALNIDVKQLLFGNA